MILVLGLLLAGMAAAGLVLADSFRLLLGCWTLGAVLQAGLAAAGRGRRAANAARHAFLVEIFGAWALGLGGLLLVLSAGTANLDLLPLRLVILDLGREALPWAGLGVLLAVLARLGLAPLPWWTPWVTAAPAVVRIFLQAGLHPITAVLLWLRLDDWLLPWHRTAALWCGAGGALLLILAAMGERHGARRAAFLISSRWAALLAVASHGHLAAVDPWLLATGAGLIHLAAATPRWPLAWRRTLLALGGVLVLGPGFPSLLGRPTSWPLVALLAGSGLLAVGLLGRWVQQLGPARGQAIGPDDAGSGSPLLGWSTRLGREPGPAIQLLEHTTASLARLAATIDRVVLDGVVEGLGWLSLGAGWLVAWLDRRGLDVLGHGAGALTARVGRGCARAAGGEPAHLVTLAMVAILLLALLVRA